MSIWFAHLLGLWALYWAALLAQLAHLRTREDGSGATLFGCVSGALLTAGIGLFGFSAMA